MSFYRNKSLNRQRGVATLIMSLILLTTLTFVIFYTARGVVMEQKIATNDFRGRMAFEAAEKGIESAMAAIANEWTINATVDADGNIVTTLVTDNVVFDVDDDGTVANNSNSDTLANGSTVTVTINGTISEEQTRYDLTSVGVSDDATATQTINQTFVILPPIPNTPDAPLLSRSAIVIGGSATVTNPEGHSTIWSGGDVNVGSNAATSTAIADPTDSNYPDCLGGSVRCGTTPSSSTDVLGLDIIGNDSSLSNLSDEEFFYNFLGDYPDNFKDSRTDEITSNLPDFDATAEGLVIWQEGNISMAAGNTFGSMTEPALIIIDGDLEIAGNNFFYGMVFITGEIKGTGNLTVVGSAVVNGVGTSGGSVDVEFNSQVLKLLNQLGGQPAGTSGSWRDFI